jgi:hypothetical protein
MSLEQGLASIQRNIRETSQAGFNQALTRRGSIDECNGSGAMSEALTIIVDQVEEVEAVLSPRASGRRNAILDAKMAREVYRRRPPPRPTRLDMNA